MAIITSCLEADKTRVNCSPRPSSGRLPKKQVLLFKPRTSFSLLKEQRENAAIGSIELILSSPAFDFAEVNGENIPEVGDATYRLVQGSVWTDGWYKNLKELAKKAGEAIEKGVSPTKTPEETENTEK